MVSVKPASSTPEPYEQYASQCEKRNQAVYTVRYTLPRLKTTAPTEYVKPTTERLLLPEDQPINDSSVGGMQGKSCIKEKYKFGIKISITGGVEAV